MEQIGPYKILKRLGGGGFGEVWLGESPLRLVAIKVFNPKDENLIAFATSSDTEGLDILRARFLNEAKILADLETNSHIVNVHEFGELEDGSPYYVMAYLPRSLTELLGKDVYDAAAVAELPEAERPRSIPLNDALNYLEQLLIGLGAAHELGLVHRDIKPSNIMLGDDNQLRLVDFGIAKAPDGQHSTVSQLGMGSRNYMAPEQRESAKHVDARADVYAVGTVAYRMITGRLPGIPFREPSVYVSELAQALNDLIVQCLSDKDERPANATILLEQFRKVRNVQTGDGEGTGTWVGGDGESTIKDELKPLRDDIRTALDDHVELTDADRAGFSMAAGVFDLSDEELVHLIELVESELGQALKLKRNFLKVLDTQLANGDLSDVARAQLIKTAEPVGWSAEDVERLIEARTPEEAKSPEPTEAESAPSEPEPIDPVIDTTPPEPLPSTVPIKSSGSRWGVLMLLALLVVGGGYGYTVYQEQQEQERIAAEQAALERTKARDLKRQDDAAWAEAESANTVAAYSAYIKQSFATGARKAEANQLIARLERADEQARQRLAKLDADRKAKTERDRLAKLEVDRKAEAARQAAIKKNAEEARLAAEALAAKSKPGAEGKDCSDCPTLVTIPAGRFRMGDLSGGGEADEKPVRTVTVPSFLMGKYEVTFAEYDVFARSTNRDLPKDRGWGRGNRPAINVSWDDAQAYVAWLSKKTNKRYRLPTESEWEYAARAGTETKYSWGNDIGRNKANCFSCGSQWDGKQTAPVGSFGSNPFGLHDLHGNVWEWTQDCYQNYASAPLDGAAVGGASSSSCSRVLRGGAWTYRPADLRSAYRNREAPSWRLYNGGFRVAQDL